MNPLYSTFSYNGMCQYSRIPFIKSEVDQYEKLYNISHLAVSIDGTTAVGLSHLVTGEVITMIGSHRCTCL